MGGIDEETKRECAAAVSFHTVNFAHELLCRSQARPLPGAPGMNDN